MATLLPLANVLPRELLDSVMDYLLEDDDNPSSSLKAVSLVCRSFVSSSQSRLFASISLRAPSYKREKSGGCGLSSALIVANSKRGFKSSIEAFSCTIAASPHLLGYVRCLDLHGSIYPPQPPLPPDHIDWFNSQSHHLMTFLPNLAPKLKSFGMYMVNWNTLLPEVVNTIKTIFESKRMTTLTLDDTINLPVPMLVSREHIRHLSLKVRKHWIDWARTCSVSNHQKLKLISLKLSAPGSVIDWLSTEHCIFDISHLRHLDISWGHHNLSGIFRTCSSSLESFGIQVGCLNSPQKGLDAINMSSLTALRELHFHISLTPGSSGPSGEPRHSLSWVNNLLKCQSQMLALEEIVLKCSIIYKPSIPLDLSPFSETDSILARGKNLPALQSITILVKCILLGCDHKGYTFNVMETIQMRMPLLHDMGIVRVRQR